MRNNILISLLLVFAMPLAGATQYSIEKACPGVDCSPTVLNDNGDVAGSGFVQYRNSRGYVSLTGFIGPFAQVGSTAMNNEGIVVGYSSTAFGQPNTPFAYIPGDNSFFNLRDVFGWTEGFATSINNQRAVVGWGRLNSGATVLPSVFSAFDTGAQPLILRINDSGQILTNLAESRSGFTGGLLYTPGKGVEQLPGRATLMNNRGQVVLQIAATRYVLYTPGEGTIPLPDSVPNQYGTQVSLGYSGLNDNGELVGNRSATDENRATLTQGFYYDSNSGSPDAVPLNDLIPPNAGLFLTRALAINNRGQILTDAASFPSGVTVILTPQ